MTNDELKAFSEALDAFLDSYSEEGYPRSLFGPVVYQTAPRWWQFRKWNDNADTASRLAYYGLPELTPIGRALFHMQDGQFVHEDAGGFLRRRWAMALGVNFSDWIAFHHPDRAK